MKRGAGDAELHRLDGASVNRIDVTQVDSNEARRSALTLLPTAGVIPRLFLATIVQRTPKEPQKSRVKVKVNF